jgi:hypothetical protein
MIYSEKAWRKEASLILKSELVRRDIAYQDLVGKLSAVGVTETVSGIKGKLHRGTFSFVWMLQCLEAIDINEFRFSVQVKTKL